MVTRLCHKISTILVNATLALALARWAHERTRVRTRSDNASSDSFDSLGRVRALNPGVLLGTVIELARRIAGVSQGGGHWLAGEGGKRVPGTNAYSQGVGNVLQQNNNRGIMAPASKSKLVRTGGGVLSSCFSLPTFSARSSTCALQACLPLRASPAHAVLWPDNNATATTTNNGNDNINAGAHHHSRKSLTARQKQKKKTIFQTNNNNSNNKKKMTTTRARIRKRPRMPSHPPASTRTHARTRLRAVLRARTHTLLLLLLLRLLLLLLWTNSLLYAPSSPSAPASEAAAAPPSPAAAASGISLRTCNSHKK